MRPVRIFRHVHHEGPGYLEDALRRAGLGCQVVAVDAGEQVPVELHDVAGVVLMGGGMSVNDPLPWVSQEVELIRRAARNGVPVLGHCLGGQLVSKALGGTVQTAPAPEIGWFPVHRAAAFEKSVWPSELPEELEVFHWHSEMFTLPAGAVPLLASAACPNQAFVAGTALALQFHVEMTEEMVREWADRAGEDLTAGATVQTAAELTADLPQRVRRLHEVADLLWAPWLAMVTARG